MIRIQVAALLLYTSWVWGASCLGPFSSVKANRPRSNFAPQSIALPPGAAEAALSSAMKVKQLASNPKASLEDRRAATEALRNWLKRNEVTDGERVALAEILLNRKLTAEESDALLRAHNQPGTIEDLKPGEKFSKSRRIASGFSEGTSRDGLLLLDSGLAGTPPDVSRKPVLSPPLEAVRFEVAPDFEGYGKGYTNYVTPPDGPVANNLFAWRKRPKSAYGNSNPAAQKDYPAFRISEGKGVVQIEIEWPATDLVGEDPTGRPLGSTHASAWTGMPQTVRDSLVSSPVTGRYGINGANGTQGYNGYSGRIAMATGGYRIKVPPGFTEKQVADHIAAKLVQMGLPIRLFSTGTYGAELKPNQLEGLRQMMAEWVTPQAVSAADPQATPLAVATYQPLPPKDFDDLLKGFAGLGKPFVANRVWSGAVRYEGQGAPVQSAVPTTPVPVRAPSPPVIPPAPIPPRSSGNPTPPPAVIARTPVASPLALPPVRAPSPSIPPRPSGPPPRVVNSPWARPATENPAPPPPVTAKAPIASPFAPTAKAPSTDTPSDFSSQRFAINASRSGVDAQTIRSNFDAAFVAAQRAIPSGFTHLSARAPRFTPEQRARLIQVYRRAAAEAEDSMVPEAAFQKAFSKFEKEIDDPTAINGFREQVRQFDSRFPPN